MPILTIIFTLFSVFSTPAAYAEVCDGIPARPVDPITVQVPCDSSGWRMHEFPGEFALCIPDDLIEVKTQSGGTNSVKFERDDLFVLTTIQSMQIL